MNTRPENLLPRTGIVLLVLAGLLALNGCTVKFVSDYDAATYEEILRVGKAVDKFYGDLLEEDESKRSYDKYSEAYVELETELRSLVTRNKSRPLNSESTKISESILKLWIKYKTRHKQKNTYKTGNAKLDRNRFIRLFVSAASAENAKKLDPDDADSSKDSKEAP
jgi:hypothetical protein